MTESDEHYSSGDEMEEVAQATGEFYGMEFSEKLNTMYNKFQDVVGSLKGEEEFNLPQIVVVGDQSAGKSSVLESLVNKSFLPRGESLVTRCPIVLRLHRTNGGNPKEWVEFGHDEGTTKKQWEFNKVAKEISAQTNRLAGDNKGIVNKPITVSVYSPNVVPLTVVDLPGIVKVPTGDQPEDIEDQVNELMTEYISKPSSIILAITPATQDIATSESLKISRKMDPNGERTLAVLTKLDLFQGTNEILHDTLHGNTIQVKYGIIGVRNPSAKEMARGMTMEAIRREEAKVLQLKCPGLASKNGSKVLANRLSQLLMRHILKRLPGLETKIAEKTKSYEDILAKLGSDDIPNKSKTMSTAITLFCKRFDGEFLGLRRNIDLENLSGGARVKVVYLDVYAMKLAVVDPLKAITEDQIANAILNSTAFESGVTIPEAAYQDLVKKEIKKLLPPSLECIHEVREEMQSTIENCMDEAIAFQFPRLTEHIVGVVTKHLNDRLNEVIKILELHVEIESSFVTTVREDFRKQSQELLKSKDITNSSFAKSVLMKIKQTTGQWGERIRKWMREKTEALDAENTDDEEGTHGDPSDSPESSESDSGVVNDVLGAAAQLTGTALLAANPVAAAAVSSVSGKHRKPKRKSSNHSKTHLPDDEIVKKLIKAYFEIVRQSFRDYLPKLLSHSIYQTCDTLPVILNEQLHTADKIDDLVRVSDDARAQREDARSELEKLKKGEKIIQEFRAEVDF